MNPEYEKGVTEQNHLLCELLELDRDAEDFEAQFDRVAAELMRITKDLDRLMQSNLDIRRALAL